MSWLMILASTFSQQQQAFFHFYHSNFSSPERMIAFVMGSKRSLIYAAVTLALYTSLIHTSTHTSHPTPFDGTESVLLISKDYQSQPPQPMNANSLYRGKIVDPQQTFYSRLRPDRSGSTIQDMLMAAAYAMKSNLTYGGACDESYDQRELEQNKFGSLPHNNTNATLFREKPSFLSPRVESILHLIRGLGLERVIPLACPPPNFPYIPVVNRIYYSRLNTAVFTREFLQWVEHERQMAGAVKRTEINEAATAASVLATSNQFVQTGTSDLQPKQIALHIRRGDVTPCSRDPEILQRYLTSKYYQSVLEHYVLRYPSFFNHSVVTIYSETETLEPWVEFLKKYNTNNEKISVQTTTTGNTKASTISQTIFLPHAWYTSHRHSSKTPKETTFFQIRLLLNTDLLAAWQAMITADVFLLSKSSFSLVPALLNTPMNSDVYRRILYTDFWYDPLPQWTRIDSMLQWKEHESLEEVQAKYC